MNDGKFVALVYEACPACGKKDEGQSSILLHQKLKDISELDKQVIGIGNLCAECAVHAEKGIFFIGVDEAKTEDIQNPYRTGQVIVLRDRAVQDMMPDRYEEFAKSRLCYCDYRIIEQLNPDMPKYKP